jgi:hypothetical protein
MPIGTSIVLQENIVKFKRIYAMGFKMVLYICDKKGVIEKHVYSIYGVVIEPACPVNVIFID